MLGALIISFLGTNGTMYYILFKHRLERKSSVSLHAAINNSSHATFALGHLIGGMAFLYFAYRYFYNEHASSYLLLLAFFGVFAEQVQAFVPHKKGIERIHVIAAASMAVLIALIVLSAPFIIQLVSVWFITYASLVLLLFASGLYVLLNKDRFYRTQMLFFSLFYIFLLLLLYGAVE